MGGAGAGARAAISAASSLFFCCARERACSWRAQARCPGTPARAAPWQRVVTHLVAPRGHVRGCARRPVGPFLAAGVF